MLDLDSINVLQIGGENYFISNADDFIDLIRNKLGNDAADYVMAINNQVSEREEDLQYEVEDLQRDINYLESDIDDLKEKISIILDKNMTTHNRQIQVYSWDDIVSDTIKLYEE